MSIISRLFSTEVWGGHPAGVPTNGSLAYRYNDSASLSSQGRSISRGVSIIVGVIVVWSGYRLRVDSGKEIKYQPTVSPGEFLR